MFARWKRGGYNKNCPNDRDNFARSLWSSRRGEEKSEKYHNLINGNMTNIRWKRLQCILAFYVSIYFVWFFSFSSHFDERHWKTKHIRASITSLSTVCWSCAFLFFVSNFSTSAWKWIGKVLIPQTHLPISMGTRGVDYRSSRSDSGCGKSAQPQKITTRPIIAIDRLFTA